jgi:hypothetical protein
MLHSLPALLEELDRTLLRGEDTIPLIGSVRWSEIVDWPKDIEQAKAIRAKIARIKEINPQISFSARATLTALSSDAPYKAKGGLELPASFTSRIEASA